MRRGSADLLISFSFTIFQNSLCTCAGVCILFDLIMQVGSSGREYWHLIGCCHLNQMFSGNFSPERSHRKNYAGTDLRANAIIFDRDTISNSQKLRRSRSCIGQGLHIATLSSRNEQVLKSNHPYFFPSFRFWFSMQSVFSQKSNLRICTIGEQKFFVT